MKLDLQSLSTFQVLLLSCFAFFCFGTHDVLSKVSGHSIGFGMSAIFIQLSCAFFTILYIISQRKLDVFFATNRKPTFYCALLGTVGMLGFYFAVLHLPLIELFIIILLRPALTTVLAKIFLNESISKYQVTALLLGILATLITFQAWNIIFNQNSFDYNVLGILGGFLNVTCMSARYILIKKSTAQNDLFGLIFYSSIGITIASIPFLEDIMIFPTIEIMLLMVLAGLLIFIGNIASFTANHSKHVATLAIGQFTILLWVAFYGWLIFNETPDIWATLGSAIILISGTMLYLDAKQK